MNIKGLHRRGVALFYWLGGESPVSHQWILSIDALIAKGFIQKIRIFG